MMDRQPASNLPAVGPYSRAWRGWFHKKRHVERYIIIHSRRRPWPSSLPMAACHLAAIEIQRIFRGFLGRQYANQHAVTVLDQSPSDFSVEESERLRAIVEQDCLRPKTPEEEDEDEIFAQKAQKRQIAKKAKERMMDKFADTRIHSGDIMDRLDNYTFEDFAATRIQAFWRMKLVQVPPNRRRKRPNWNIKQIAAHVMQLAWWDYLERLQAKHATQVAKEKKIVISKWEKGRKGAVDVISRCWDRYSSTRIFQYYKDLIKFKERGDPRIMLRSINPNECSLLEKASGAIVRFRLGGEEFPPQIFYKIFSRTMVDLNSFAPRDYASLPKKIDPLTVHNKGHGASKDPHSGWYEREENNGWRPLSDTVFRHLGEVEKKKTVVYHHNKLVRKQAVEQYRKQKKLSWLRKMYREGAMREKGEMDEDEPQHRPIDTAGSAGTWEDDTNSTFDNSKAKGIEPFKVESWTSGQPIDGGGQGLLQGGVGDMQWNESMDASGLDPLEMNDDEALFLTEWTEKLDFEKYQEEWVQLATTGTGGDSKDEEYFDEFYRQEYAMFSGAAEAAV